MLYEDYLERHDPSILDEIAAYNEEDCISTLQLRDWLLPLRPGRAAGGRVRCEPRGPPEGAEETEELRLALLAGLPEAAYDVSRGAAPGVAAGAVAAVSPARGEAGVVGVLRPDREDERGAAGARLGCDRRARARRPADRLGRFARVAVPLPGAAASSRAGRRRLRPGDGPVRGPDRGARRGGGDAVAAPRAVARGGAAAGGAHPGRADQHEGAAGGAAPAGPARCWRATSATWRASRSSCASRSRCRSCRTACRGEGSRRHGLDRRAPGDPGPAGSGKTYTARG